MEERRPVITLGQQQFGEEEIRIAMTEAVCREQTNFRANIDIVLYKYVTTRMRELAEQVTRIRKPQQPTPQALQLRLPVAAPPKFQRQS